MFQYFFTYDSEIPKGLEVKNFSPTHFAWLGATALVMFALVMIYRRLNGEARLRFTRTAMIAIIALEVIREGWAAIVGHYDVSRMLPLHLCGIMIFIEAIAVFSDKAFYKEFSYAIGLPAAVMALLTPEPSGYPFWNIQYLQSIFVHALIALIPLLWICGDGFRPNIRALPKLLALLTGLAAFDFGINYLLNSNYMFVRFAPKDTPIDLFNQLVGWPWYIGLLLVTVFVFWLAMYLPWEIAAKRKKHAATHGLPAIHS
jgi:hypothetical integral membrane protein (TIGR02206 family)